MKTQMLCCLLLAGCASIQYPFTASALGRNASGPALVAYLSQRDASARVCDNQAFVFTPSVGDALVDALVSRAISPSVFRACVERAQSSPRAEQTANLFDSIIRGYEVLLRDDVLETTPAAQERLSTLHRLYLERAHGVGPHEVVLSPYVERLSGALAEGVLGPVAIRFATELLDTVVLERAGHWRGAQVDLSMLDALAEQGNAVTLSRLALRLSSSELRTEARRRLVRVQIAISPFAEVREAAEPIETTVLMTGVNRVPLRRHPVQRAWLDPNGLVSRTVVVRQLPAKNAASLLGLSTDLRTLSLLPEISLRNVMWAQLESLSRPVTVCGDARDLDPTPCLDEGALSVDQPLVRQDVSGSFHVRDLTDLSSAIELASSERFVVPVRLGGELVTSVVWGLRYERPSDLSFSGSTGASGPNLGVRVDVLATNRFVFTVNDGSKSHVAVVESYDLPNFQVASYGGSGASGRNGQDGSDGSSGGQCGDGGRGQDGGDGGDGGSGGNGGDINVEISCGASECSELTLAKLARVIQSVGGSGGSAGRGGSGGSGGRGGGGRGPTTTTDGQGNTVVTSDGCAAGSDGASGRSGSSGSSGWSGRAGTRRVTVLPASAPHENSYRL